MSSSDPRSSHAHSPNALLKAVRKAIQRERLLDTAFELIKIPSPTRNATAVADRLARILERDGFEVSRPVAGWEQSPAVATRWTAGEPGRTLQFNGHLDTVHLPFVPPRVEDAMLYGSGASDMKGGIAAMVEAMRALRDAELLPTGSILLTAHDLHESPWGDGSQVNALIDEGWLGDGVLLPEYLCDRIPVIGRGLAVLDVTIRREGEPIHEVLGGIDQPSVIRAGAMLVEKLAELDSRLRVKVHEQAGRESVFVGQVASGEIFNQAPTEFKLSGTRRWLPETQVEEVEQQFQSLLQEVALATGTQVSGVFHLARDAFELDPHEDLITTFQQAHRLSVGHELPCGAKPFVDDGNAFIRRGGVPAITHGPNARGAHTTKEMVPVSELLRVAEVYALTAIHFCTAIAPGGATRN